MVELPQFSLEAKSFHCRKKFFFCQIEIFPGTCCWLSIKLTCFEVSQNNDWSHTVYTREHFGQTNSRLELYSRGCLLPQLCSKPLFYLLIFRNLKVSSFTDCYIGRAVLSLMTPSRGEAVEQWRRAPKSACYCGRTGSYARGRRYGGIEALSD